MLPSNSKHVLSSYKTKRLMLILTSIILALFACFLLLFFLFGRVIAQRAANKATITLNGIDITKVPKTSTLIPIQVTAHATYFTPFQARITQAKIRVRYQNMPFANILATNLILPRGNHSEQLIIDATADITNIPVLSRMSERMFVSEQITLLCEADIAVSIVGMQYTGIKLERPVAVLGMQAFRKIPPEIHSIELQKCRSDKVQLAVDVSLDNISQLGVVPNVRLRMNVYYEKMFLGYATSHSNLRRGKNRQTFIIIIATHESSQLAVIQRMVTGILSNHAEFLIAGDNSNVSNSLILNSAFRSLKLSITYTEGMRKVRIGSDCHLDFMGKR